MNLYERLIDTTHRENQSHTQQIKNSSAYSLSITTAKQNTMLRGVDFSHESLNHDIIHRLSDVLVDEIVPWTHTDFPIVTGASADHYNEALTSLYTMIQTHVNRTVYFYDLGLTDHQRNQVKVLA